MEVIPEDLIGKSCRVCASYKHDICGQLGTITKFKNDRYYVNLDSGRTVGLTRSEFDLLKTYYCVTSAYHDSGRVTAAITMSRKCSIKPSDHKSSHYDRDIYTEWYDNLTDAEKAVADARAESTPRE